MNHTRQITLITLLIAMSIAVSGCAPIAWLAAVLAPPKPVPAEFKLATEGKVLVLVDDLGKPVRYEQIKRLLTENINRLLVDNKAVERVVSYDDIFRLTASRKDFNQMGIANIARKLGANQTIFVSLNEFSLKDDANIDIWHGKLGVSVRVVDIEGKTEWPIDRPDGRIPDPAEIPEEQNASPTHGTKIAAKLADDMALKIAKFFFDTSEAQGHTGGKN
jgi:hypothetical protein